MCVHMILGFFMLKNWIIINDVSVRFWITNASIITQQNGILRGFFLAFVTVYIGHSFTYLACYWLHRMKLRAQTRRLVRCDHHAEKLYYVCSL